jgi:hypothetical protein
MGFGFDFVGQRAVVQQQCLAVKAIESVLAVATAPLDDAVGTHSRGKIGE